MSLRVIVPIEGCAMPRSPVLQLRRGGFPPKLRSNAEAVEEAAYETTRVGAARGEHDAPLRRDADLLRC